MFNSTDYDWPIHPDELMAGQGQVRQYFPVDELGCLWAPRSLEQCIDLLRTHPPKSVEFGDGIVGIASRLVKTEFSELQHMTDEQVKVAATFLDTKHRNAPW